MQYDAAIFSVPRVASGENITSRGVAASNSPEAGRLDVVVFGPTGVSALAVPSGTIFEVTLNIDDSAMEGQTYPVTVIQGSSFFPGSGMSNLAGVSLSHTTEGGQITISAPATPTPTSTPGPATPTPTPGGRDSHSNHGSKRGWQSAFPGCA